MFEIFNYSEAYLWTLFAFGFAVRSRRSAKRSECVVAACAFLLFGLSDVVEVQTGAWWRPWWLLVWKALCLMVFLVLIIRYRRRSKADSSGQAESVNDPR